MRSAAILALFVASPAFAEELTWVEVGIDSVEMRAPDLPTLSLFWEEGTNTRTHENANSLVLSRGVAHEVSSPMDDIIATLSSKADLGRVTLISVGPMLPEWDSNVRCSEEPVTILDHDVSAFCYEVGTERQNTQHSQYLVSDKLWFFETPVRLNCSSLQLENDPFGVNCRLRSRMPNGLGVNVDLYLNEQEDWAWPDLHGSEEDWQSDLAALEVALTSMLSN